MSTELVQLVRDLGRHIHAQIRAAMGGRRAYILLVWEDGRTGYATNIDDTDDIISGLELAAAGLRSAPVSAIEDRAH